MTNKPKSPEYCEKDKIALAIRLLQDLTHNKIKGKVIFNVTREGIISEVEKLEVH